VFDFGVLQFMNFWFVKCFIR